MSKHYKLLKELCEANGIAANEKAIKQIMKREFLKIVEAENIIYDGLGSIAAKLGKNGPKIAIAGHMDEVGMIVTKITDDGFLKFQTIGGWWSQVMLAQQYTVTAANGKEYLAIMGSKPPHILSAEDRKNPADIEQMYLDLGVTSKDEIVKMGIKIGDMITPKIESNMMANNDFMVAKALDDRMGCAIVLGVLEALKNSDHPNIVYGVGTVQEEVGTRGAKTMANLIAADINISLDVSIAKDVPGTDNSIKMGLGPDILIYDSGMVGHVDLRNLVVETAEENNIPFQLDYIKAGSTDASSMHIANCGAPSIAICVASRYIHSHTSMISLKDLENCIKLIVLVIQKLDQDKVNNITYN